VTEDEWQRIEKTLPSGADRVHFRKQLERIARNDATPAQRLEQCDYQIDLCRRFLSVVPKLDAFEDKTAIIAQLERQIKLTQQTREVCRQVPKRSQIFLRQCEILLLWLSRGNELPISSKGPHIDFFAAAYSAVFGKAPPDPESIKNIIKRFRHLKLALFAGAGNMSVSAEVIPAPVQPSGNPAEHKVTSETA
jgi:hypothetical protein